MIEPVWERDVPGFDPPGVAEPAPGLVTLHFLRAALRRTRRLWLGLAAAGLALGAVATVVMPAPSTATVTLLLSHEMGSDTTQAVANDLSLLETRTVASAVIDQLGLEVTPEDFQASITIVSNGSSILVVTVDGDGDRDAVARADALATQYLTFRRSQLESQTDSLIAGYQSRVATLESRVQDLDKRYDELAAGGPGSQAEAADVLSQRSQLGAEINSLRATIENTSLSTSSALDGTHVLDPASVVPVSWKRRLLLAMASGLVGGAGLGVGLVLFRALTSDKLRRRVDVATALGVPVVSTVWTGTWREVLRPAGTRDRGLAVVVEDVVRAVGPRRRKCTRLAVVSVDVMTAASRVVEAAAQELAGHNRRALIVDLSSTSLLPEVVGQSGEHQSAVFRPPGIRSLARGPIPPEDALRPTWDRADVVLTLVEADPSIGLGELGSWADRAIVLVGAGESNAERLRTAAEMLRASGVSLELGVLLGSDAHDESLGQPEAVASDGRLREIKR